MGQANRQLPKVREISEHAGVSRATVDRVINKRPGVQAHTRRHVLSVIDELTCQRTGATADTAEDLLHLDFIIPDHGNAFLLEQAHQLQSYAQQLGTVSLSIHHPDTASEDEIVAVLQRIAPTTQAVGLIGLDSRKVREAVRKLGSRDIPVVTLASDIRNVPRTAYVGIDNHAAGRLAGYLTGRMLNRPKGKIGLVLGSRAYFGHEEREMGFRSILREQFPTLRIVEECEVQENADLAYREVSKILSVHPDLDAIYCIGAGQSGVAKALIDCGCGASVMFIGHGLSTDTRNHLVNGVMDAIIEESAADEARLAIECLVAALRHSGDINPTAIPIHAIFRENLPAET
tara:strand:- start:14561 stop:15598 length:1038 start_codon:yes stop_codon:yes gene_type:complete